MASLLQVEALSRSFGGVRAVDTVSFTVEAGSIHGIIGPNGAGKTTLINLLTGFIAPTAGHIALAGVSVGGLPPHRIAHLGVARTFQNIRLCPTLSVLDNIWVAQRASRGHPFAHLARHIIRTRGERQLAAAEQASALELLGALGVSTLDGQRAAGTLSYGDQRRVEVARAVATQPRLLLLDEPTAGMNREETDRMGATIRHLSTPERAIILIEHDLPLIMSVCTRITVLNFGRVIATGSPAEVAAHPAVIEAYLGSDDDEHLEEIRGSGSPPPTLA